MENFIKVIRESLKTPEEKKLIDLVTNEKFLKNDDNDGISELLNIDVDKGLNDKFQGLEKSRLL